MVKGLNDQGPDHIHISKDGKRYYFEAIAFSIDREGHGTGKNQSDFWKAFSQALSRLNPQSRWEPPDYTIIALPWDHLNGWRQRTAQLGEDVWRRIGDAFPQLEIWFVSETELLCKSWNEAYHAGAQLA